MMMVVKVVVMMIMMTVIVIMILGVIMVKVMAVIVDAVQRRGEYILALILMVHSSWRVYRVNL